MALVTCRSCNEKISKNASTCPHCGEPRKKKGSLSAIQVVGILMVLGLLVSIFTAPDTAPRSSASSGPSPAEKARILRQEALANLDFDFSWRKTAADSIMEATFKVTNNNAFPVKDIDVRCTHSGPSGTVIDRNARVIYEVVPAGESRTFENFNMGFIHSQAVKTGCVIRDIAF